MNVPPERQWTVWDETMRLNWWEVQVPNSQNLWPEELGAWQGSLHVSVV